MASLLRRSQRLRFAASGLRELHMWPQGSGGSGGQRSFQKDARVGGSAQLMRKCAEGFDTHAIGNPDLNIELLAA